MSISKSVLLLLCVHHIAAKSINDYKLERNLLLEQEFTLQVGGKITLNEDELVANSILMKHKHQQLNESFYNPQYFNLSRHYFTYKDDINSSKVYQIIKRMPKGGALHIHSSLMLSADRLLTLTYQDHLYACFVNDDLYLHFSLTVPQRPCATKWELISDLRNNTDNILSFDASLKRYFTLYSEDEKYLHREINIVWDKFNKVCHNIKQLIGYRPVREIYLYEALKEFYEDKVMYIEVRSGLQNLYELDGTVHDLMYMPRLFHRVAKKFREEHPDFIGIKFIVTRNRAKNESQVREVIEIGRQMQKELPDMFAGFDLVGQEDLGKPLLEFLPILEEAKNDMNFYFHGGETNWFGTPTDENLVDAIMLGSKRIGHAYGLIKHPSLMAAVRAKDIAIEVNVISNVVLSLVSDVRNHPLAAYLAFGLPVVLSSDDPGAWGADPLSHDFYITFVGIASKRADLRLLKQLVINSIKYSALDSGGKLEMFRQFHKQWNHFITDVVTTYR